MIISWNWEATTRLPFVLRFSSYAKKGALRDVQGTFFRVSQIYTVSIEAAPN